MFQKGLSIVLACLLVLSLTACAASGQKEAPVQAEAAPETTEAPTEPTLSPEELLIASLPEKVKEAYDLGLVELELLKDLDRVCLGAEAAQIVQNIHTKKHGTESKIMNQLFTSDHAGIEVTRYWLAQTMFAAEAEFLEEAPYEDYLENIDYMLKQGSEQSFWTYFLADGANVHTNDNPENQEADYEPDIYRSSGWMFAPDRDDAWEIGELYIDCSPDPSLPYFVMTAYDRLTGEKIMEGNMFTPFLPREKMTVREVVETTLRYHNWIPPVQELLPYEELPTYDTSIIIEELLTKETALPEASCQNLPASWRGIASTAMTSSDTDALTDRMLQENDIQAIADAGFNFLRLHFDFRYLASEEFSYWPGWMTDPVVGYMNETRLKELDQIIAWCMERDIHVNLVSKDAVAGWDPMGITPVILSNEQNAKPLGEQWAVLARRYDAIPNTYLSFTLMDTPEIWTANQYGKFFTPVVEAIQAVSPDRCIIACMDARDAGQDMAALGVALAAQVGAPSEFSFHDLKTDARNTLFESIEWPYENSRKLYSAESCIGLRTQPYELVTPDEVYAVAEEYGVGFMVYDWAPSRSRTPVLRERWNDAFMDAYFADFAEVLAQRGYGWCYGDLNGCIGLFSAYPSVESTTYTQVGNAPLYIDDEMFARFQKLNGVQ